MLKPYVKQLAVVGVFIWVLAYLVTKDAIYLFLAGLMFVAVVDQINKSKGSN